MKALALAALVALGAGCGCANLKDTTHIATGVDAGSTVIGVTSGLAVEANPLIANPAIFVGVMLARVLATEKINAMPEPQRTEYLSMMSSIWIGPGVGNFLYAIGATGPIGIAAGAMVGLGWWASTADRRAFAEICAQAQITNPATVCTFTPT